MFNHVRLGLLYTTNREVEGIVVLSVPTISTFPTPNDTQGWLSVCPEPPIEQSNSIMEIIMKDLNELFLEELADIYDAEKQLVKALPKMAEAANSQELQSAFEEHLEQTQQQVQRVEEVFRLFDAKAKGKKCEAMAGLIEEAEEVMREEATPSVMDAALIAAAQKVEHYEIATYGCLRTWAELLGKDEALDLLEETLNEEKDADESLTDIATNINEQAKEGTETEEESSQPGRTQ